MNEFNLSLAYQRIRRLESLITAVLVLLVVLAFWLYQALSNQTGVIRASGFQLINEDGNTMGGLEFLKDFPSLYLTDSEGNKRLVATHNNTATQLFLNDELGTVRVGVAQFSHGGGGFALHGERSKGAAVLYFKEQGSLRFFDADGTVTHQLQAQEDQP